MTPPPAKKFGLLLAALGAWALLAAPAQAYRPRVLRMGFVPSENVQEVMRNAQPIVTMMREQLGCGVVPFVATDYTGVIEAMRAGRLDVAFFAPGAYLLAERAAKAQVILRVVRDGKSVFYSAIITHRDSPIRSLKDLKGKKFAFVDPASLSGALYPKVMFMNEGINPERDFEKVVFAGGHDATVLAVLNRQVDAGATFCNDNQGKHGSWHQFLKDPKKIAQIRVVAFSKPMPADNIAVAKGLDADLVARIRAALLRLSSTPAGLEQLRRIYRIDGFAPSTPADYASMREVFDKVGYKGP